MDAPHTLPPMTGPLPPLVAHAVTPHDRPDPVVEVAARPLPERGGTDVQRRGVVGTVLALLLGAGKYGFALLKFAKLGPTLVSMVLSVGALALLFGPRFGIGLLALIAVHESGHVLFARREGIRVSMPVFLGPFGAVIGMKQPPKDARQEAVIAIGGPVVGTLGAVACALVAGVLAPGSGRNLMLALAYVGFFLNLFNLVPVTPLDGGRVASALSRWANLVGLAVVAVYFVATAGAGHTPNPFLLVILVLGVFGTLQRFRQARANPEYLAVPAATRVWIGAAYVGMLLATAAGMSLTHAALQAATVV